MSKYQLKVEHNRENIIANFIRGMAMSAQSLQAVAVLSTDPIDPVSASNSVVESMSDVISNLQSVSLVGLDLDVALQETYVDDRLAALFRLSGDDSISLSSIMLDEYKEAVKQPICHLVRPTDLYVLVVLDSGVRNTDQNRMLTETFIKQFNAPQNFVAFSSNHNEVESCTYTTKPGLVTLEITPNLDDVVDIIRSLEKAEMLEIVS